MVIRPRPRMTMSTLPLPYPLIPSPLPYLRLPSFPPPNPSRPAPLPEKSTRTSTNTVTRLLRGAQNTKTPQNNTTKRKPKTTVYNTSIHKHTYRHKTLPWYTKKKTHTHTRTPSAAACMPPPLLLCTDSGCQPLPAVFNGYQRLPTVTNGSPARTANRSTSQQSKEHQKHSTPQHGTAGCGEAVAQRDSQDSPPQKPCHNNGSLPTQAARSTQKSKKQKSTMASYSGKLTSTRPAIKKNWCCLF